MENVDDGTYKESSSKKSWSHSSLGVTPLIPDKTITPCQEEKRKHFRGMPHHSLFKQQLPIQLLTFGSFCFFFRPRFLVFIGEFWNANKHKAYCNVKRIQKNIHGLNHINTSMLWENALIYRSVVVQVVIYREESSNFNLFTFSC